MEKIYILGALLKLPFFIHDEEMRNCANSYLTFHSWSPLIREPSPYRNLLSNRYLYFFHSSILGIHIDITGAFCLTGDHTFPADRSYFIVA